MARIASHILPELHLLAGTLSAARIARTRQQTADGNIDLPRCLPISTIAVSRGRDVLLREGEAVLTSEDVTIRSGSPPATRSPSRLPARSCRGRRRRRRRHAPDPAGLEAARLLTSYATTR